MKINERLDTLWRSMRVLSLVRVILITAILAVTLVSESGLLSPWQPRSIVASYLGLALVVVLLNAARAGSYNVQLAGALVLDLLHIAGLIYWSDSSRSVFASLLFLPVVGAALLAPRVVALGTASLASIILLSIGFMHYTGSSDDAVLLQTALLGTGFLTAALVLNKIGQRVLQQEALVREQRRRLESQVQINRTVVSELDRGLLALNSEGEVLLLNLQAARLLGINTALGEPVQSALSALSPELLQKMQEWQQAIDGESIPAHCDLTVAQDLPVLKKGVARRIRIRPLANTAPRTPANELLVALEDLRELEGRATQLKLASMGRLTASIAHEIRNPLAAVSHAAALMSEEAGQEPSRLLRIIQDNVRRIDRIIEDVLSISRSGRVRAEPVALFEALRQAVSELQRDNDSTVERVNLSVPRECFVWFDREHLAQILNNLLQNASRYAGTQKGAISISAHLTPVEGALEKSQWELVIQDDGPGLSAEVQAHLFEPFFTTHAQGTGLGLYLARELATANEASLFARDEKNDTGKVKGASFVLRMKQAPSPKHHQLHTHESI
jgi:two-component system sensor histidine kinase PilS (NtrC family)